ncbi:glycoside hydrolase family 15 protein [Nocardioides marmotae]|uniref:glycoside hydrolase family 15 protein n=1 Tax=Nocardioides marmotae TaxID=2663857 RepID=UPI0012B67790|nr:glycoside hydrolase family 15 protein [Nocardioides marmotae]MBC9733495.1 glycoside hydrolase family 15 protein [Nocardioides marmotae]MTB84602.1 glycoside hydrolase family 15 protein [Nocardioides marmotae]
MALPIEDYAVIGDRRTAALVGTNGSIDWLCLPRFDSPACLAGLLGTPEHGHWQLVPEGVYSTERRYVGASAVLETTFTTADGVVRLTDLMPRGDGRADVVRRVSGVSGRVRMRHEWRIRLDYGAVHPWVRRHHLHGEDVIVAIAGPDQLVLRGPRLPRATDHSHNDEFEVGPGDDLVFTMTWLPSHVPLDDLHDLGDRVAQSIDEDEAWARSCREDLPHADLVRRSLLTLRLMTHEETGGIVAAPTTSLPEEIGGERNWDYRFCWLRDAALTITSLIDAGYTEEAMLWRAWLLRSVAGDPQDLQIMYAVDGARRLPEHELPHLPGYAGSLPVRIGNGAAVQKQHDVLGEVMDALDRVRTVRGTSDDEAWALQRALVDDLARHWQEPDHGIWEIRGEPRHFTHSRAMVWVAFDRAVRAVEVHGLPGPVEKWRRVRDEVHAEVLARGWNEEKGTFTQHYDTDEVDASLLVLPLVGFLPADDPRILGTIEAIERELMRDGLLLRYRTETGVDGLAGDEHPFLACSFWLVSAYALAGRVKDAHALFDRLAALANDVGLLAEEYDPVASRMTGNFPQAFSHLTLVQAALVLADAGPA